MSSAGNCSWGEETWFVLGRRYYQMLVNRWQAYIPHWRGLRKVDQPSLLEGVQCSVRFNCLATLTQTCPSWKSHHSETCSLSSTQNSVFKVFKRTSGESEPLKKRFLWNDEIKIEHLGSRKSTDFHWKNTCRTVKNEKSTSRGPS